MSRIRFAWMLMTALPAIITRIAAIVGVKGM
jgi:hypothetical protein